MNDETKVQATVVAIGKDVDDVSVAVREAIDEWLKQLKECHVNIAKGIEPIGKVMRLTILADLTGDQIEEVLDYLPDREKYFCGFDTLMDWNVDYYLDTGNDRACEKEIVTDKSPRDGCAIERGEIEIEVGFRYSYIYTNGDSSYEISEDEFNKIMAELEEDEEDEGDHEEA